MKDITTNVAVWNDVLGLIEPRLSADVFKTWFKPVECERFDDASKKITLRTGQVVKDWVYLYYTDMVIDSLAQLGHPDFKIEWSIDPDQTVPEPLEEEADFFFSPKRAGYKAVPQNFAVSRVTGSDRVDDGLNPKYTFEKFVVGSCNQFAHAAAKATAETPGSTYNPLFLYGGVGLGKTHLMHAIGHTIKARSPHMKVAYVTSELFMNELINAIRFNKTNSFRDKYRSIDVLLMDDVQFMAGKERTQEEFFHTFNTLHNGQKQIVVSSDCPPQEIPTLEERLHSRFQWGLIADLEPPDLETKVAILQRKADMDGIQLDHDIAVYVASKVKSNVRELEGSLVRLVAISSMKGVPISKTLAQESMKSILAAERPAGLTIEHITRTVAEHFKMSPDEIKAKSNSRSIAMPRQVAMYLCKRLTRHSFPEIGREFGGKHHTTVMHSVDKIEKLQKEDRIFHKQINELIDNLCS